MHVPMIRGLKPPSHLARLQSYPGATAQIPRYQVLPDRQKVRNAWPRGTHRVLEAEDSWGRPHCCTQPGKPRKTRSRSFAGSPARDSNVDRDTKPAEKINRVKASSPILAAFCIFASLRYPVK